MKILISAFECFPNKGSEAGVGWNWALQLAGIGHDVWVVTGGDSKEKIEAAVADGYPLPENMKFIYLDLLPWGIWGKDNLRLVRTHNYLWQLLVLPVIRKHHKAIHFDIAHHLTWGVIRAPSMLGLIGIPFVFGPLGGGETVPLRLISGMSFSGKVWEIMRILANKAIWLDPFMWLSFASADRIYAKTAESKAAIPGTFHHKTQVRQEIGLTPVPEQEKKVHIPQDQQIVNFLFAGRLIPMKGVSIALRAFSRALKVNPNIHYTIIGSGPEESRLKELAQDLGISTHVDWQPPVTQPELFQRYKNFDAMLFPSLHDSSGNAVLEAIGHGLPVICLDLGGPPIIVTDKCGIIVKAKNSSYEQTIDSLAQAINTMQTPVCAKN